MSGGADRGCREGRGGAGLKEGGIDGSRSEEALKRTSEVTEVLMDENGSRDSRLSDAVAGASSGD